MKNLFLIGGPMGVGKTAVGQRLKLDLPNAVFLDGDWCWDSNPFQVTDVTKAMVMDNICHLLQNFILCPAYENIIFCWVMHEQSIIDDILACIDTTNCFVRVISLLADSETLTRRIMGDVEKGLRTADVIPRSIARIPLYQNLQSCKIDTVGKTVQSVADAIRRI